MAAVTDFIQRIDSIVSTTVERLLATEALPETFAAPGWSVETFSPTSYKELFAYLPGLQLPAAVVCWQGADINRNPGRPQRIYHNLSVLVLAANADMEAGAGSARALIDAALALLDLHQSANATWRATGVDAVDLSATDCASGVACYAIQFEVGDH